MRILVAEADHGLREVLVQGLQAGSTRVTLTDANGVKEVVEVIVQFDIDTVRSELKRAVPTATVEPIPAVTNTIILVRGTAVSV